MDNQSEPTSPLTAELPSRVVLSMSTPLLDDNSWGFSLRLCHIRADCIRPFLSFGYSSTLFSKSWILIKTITSLLAPSYPIANFTSSKKHNLDIFIKLLYPYQILEVISKHEILWSLLSKAPLVFTGLFIIFPIIWRPSSKVNKYITIISASTASGSRMTFRKCLLIDR